MLCPACSVPVPDDARFCPACGAATAAATGDDAAEPTRTRAASISLSAPSDGARFQTGTVLAERYRIVGLLGRGGMGEVYRADDLKLGRTVALKFLPEATERDPARLVRLFHEVRTALRVTHPNVCRVYDVGETAGRHFLSMEYVDGEDLATLLRRIGRLPEEGAVRVARQLCAGLAAAHRQGVLHRDLKPANVMLDGRGEVKITDFGLAGAAEEITGAEIRSGTPAYMAPEQLEGREVTVRSDLYALGLVLYELFSGKAAFEARTPQEALSLRRSGPASLSSRVEGLDPAVARIVDRCLSSEPADRPASAAAVAAALPGGDPLAAALAAGETPSPEMVAEAGASGGFRPAVAIAWLAATILGMAAVGAVASRAVYASRVALSLSPAVLSNKAAELIRGAGWGRDTRDRSIDWVENTAYYRHVRLEETGPNRWAGFGRGQPPALLLAYRESPKPLTRMSVGSVGDWMADPPPIVPGMVEVRLDPEGRLASFAAVPALIDSTDVGESDAGAEFDFLPFFAAAGIDPVSFARAEPSILPSTYADRRYAWTGRYPDAPDVAIRVEAASLAGRPVSFRVVEPWDRTRTGEPLRATPWERIGSVVGSVWFGVVLAGAALVAARNARLGRGDHRTALRFGMYLTVARLLWLPVAHHVAAGAEIDLLRGHLAWAAYRFVLAYVFYLALEPYARRLWPEMLVSWVRIFAGRLRDPRVGRDLLLGVAAGCAFALFRLLATWVPQALGMADYGLLTTSWARESLRGVGPALGSLAGIHVMSVLDNFNGVMMFLVLRVLTRRTWIAVGLVSVAAVVMFNPGTGSPWPYLLTILLSLGLYWLVLFRGGLLPLVLMLSVADMLSGVRVTADLTAWHALPMWLSYGTAAVVAAWGFRVATAGQPLFRDEIREAWAEAP